MNSLRYGSVISQLENDQYVETETNDPIEQAWKRGHNLIVKAAANGLRVGITIPLAFVSEHEGDELERALCRGRNAGIRHVRHVLRLEAALAELAHAPVIETINEPLVDFTAPTVPGDAPDPDWDRPDQRDIGGES